MRTMLQAVGALALVVAGSAPAAGAIVASTPTVDVQLGPPAKITLDEWVDDDQARIFAERQRVTLPNAQSVNAIPPDDMTWTTFPAQKSLLAGTVVDSYLLHFDTEVDRRPATRIAGDVTFDSDILAIIVGRPLLNNTHARFGAATISPNDYLVGEQGGLEDDDRTWFSDDRRTLLFDVGVTQFADNIRVLVAATDADFDANSFVDGADLLRWQRGLGTSNGALRGAGNSNFDDAVDGWDLTNWRQQFSAAPTALQAVPEPSVWALGTTTLAWLLGRAPLTRRTFRDRRSRLYVAAMAGLFAAK